MTQLWLLYIISIPYLSFFITAHGHETEQLLCFMENATYGSIDFVHFAVGLRSALQLETADLRRKADLTQPKQKSAANKQDPKSKKGRSCMDTLDLTINVCRQPWSVSEWPRTEYDRILDPAGVDEIDDTSPGDPLAGLQQESLHDRMKVRHCATHLGTRS